MPKVPKYGKIDFGYPKNGLPCRESPYSKEELKKLEREGLYAAPIAVVRQKSTGLPGKLPPEWAYLLRDQRSVEDDQSSPE